MRMPSRAIVVAAALAAYAATASLAWHPEPPLRRAVAMVLATLVLWVSEVAPLGVVALAIPLAAVFSGALTLEQAVGAWGDPTVFLFLGAFLLARAMEKHAAFDWLLAALPRDGGIGRLAPGVLLVAGLLSTVQNNTAVAAILLPLVVPLARGRAGGACLLLALSFGATFGGLATPVGTAPNFIGFTAIKQLDASASFLTWMRVGVPAWLGTTLIGWTVLRVAAQLAPHPAAPRDSVDWFDQPALADVGPVAAAPPDDGAGRAWALGAGLLAALLWLVPGIVRGVVPPGHPAAIWVERYLPESLVPIGVGWGLFLIRVGPRCRPVLDRHDFQALDWDTLFLIAGGLCLGRVLKESGAAIALARAVGELDVAPLALTLAVAGATVLLSELTSNTATASLMVPIAGALAPAMGLSAVQAVWLVALCASMGFALPVSTPPNALIYGTRLVPLRFMAAVGLCVDLFGTLWIVACVRGLGG